MSWRKFPAALLRFITWRARINRMQFGLGYVALCFGGAIAMQLTLLTIATLTGSLEEVFNRLEWAIPAIFLLVPLLWGLIAGRAHDLGWPAWPIVMLYLLPWPAWSILMDGAFGFFGGRAARLGSNVPVWVLDAFIFGPALLITIALVVLASAPGQKRSNRYGDLPRPGLWNDLPID